jgi:hypothetical protein
MAGRGTEANAGRDAGQGRTEAACFSTPEHRAAAPAAGGMALTKDPDWTARRQFLQTLAAVGAIPAADLAWGEEPLGWPRRTHAARTRRFQFSVPEPLRLSVIESLVDRFTQSQADGEVQGEVRPPGPGTPEAHHRRGRRPRTGLLPDGGQVAGRGLPGPGAWKGRVCFGATSEVAEQVASASLPTPSQGGDRQDRRGTGHPTRRLRGLPPSNT